jgi:N-acylneuraminate cytidylyltransferase
LFKNKKILAMIPARGNSKRVPKKNIKIFCNKPLIAWTIEAAKRSKYIDKLVLSSECSEIIKIAKSYGCEIPFVRPSDLSLDKVPGIMPVLHAIEKISGYDYIVLLQTTSPLRSEKDIDAAIEHCLNKKADNCVSVVEVTQNPHWMYTKNSDGRLYKFIEDKQIARSQELPAYYFLNGAIYVSHIATLKKTENLITVDSVAYVMPEERSIDIDTQLDFKIAELLMIESQK